ncbi:hypothetical protein [Brachyspira innocens]|uniref:hypothetical protein n=1 Tax=Brachyspira innocens TaxID=13264 RepID=UPI0026EFFC8F|nr:hypothetical protein [Brachyspira innocens]
MYINNEKTDWNKYYSERKENNSKIVLAITKTTRRITDNLILNFIKKYKNNINSIIELGGADSCFYNSFRYFIPNSTYTVIDNCKVGVDIFNTKYKNDKTVAIEQDILNENIDEKLKSDLVFSAGLIEHFDINGTSTMIKKHFDYCNDNGLVLITFPTPTLLYRILRKFAEIIGIWKFPDERPLKKEEVINECKKYGSIEKIKLNFIIGLTQYIILIKK